MVRLDSATLSRLRTRLLGTDEDLWEILMEFGIETPLYEVRDRLDSENLVQCFDCTHWFTSLEGETVCTTCRGDDLPVVEETDPIPKAEKTFLFWATRIVNDPSTKRRLDAMARSCRVHLGSLFLIRLESAPPDLELARWNVTIGGVLFVAEVFWGHRDPKSENPVIAYPSIITEDFWPTLAMMHKEEEVVLDEDEYLIASFSDSYYIIQRCRIEE